MVKRRPFIPEHERRRSERDYKIRLPYRHLLDPQDPHYYEISTHLEMMRQAGVEIDQAVADNAVKLIHWEHKQAVYRPDAFRAEREARESRQAEEAERLIRESQAAERWKQSPGIVYYILRSSLIKIGTTTRPASRFSTLMPDAVLATEPGDVELERLRHDQFGAMRSEHVGREYFTPQPPLIDHIRRLREERGVPDVQHPSLLTREEAEARVMELLAP